MNSRRVRDSYRRVIASCSLGVVLFHCLLAAHSAAVDLKSDQEYQIKAVFVYNFAKFVEWPAASFKDAKAPLAMCILGNDPLKSFLDNLKGKHVEGRPVVVRKITTVEHCDECHMLFIPTAQKDNLLHILKAVQNRSILTVSDTKGFSSSGVMINLILIDNRIGFEINPVVAGRASLRISSQLLKLGKIVK